MVAARTPSPPRDVPITPTRTRNLRNTSNLSPSKFNELYGEHPSRTSPSPKQKSPSRPLPYLNANRVPNNGYPILSENIRPVFVPAKYPSLQHPEDDYIPKLVTRAHNSQHSKDYNQMLDYSAAPIDPFYDAPNVTSNVGRRRANAISLMNSPARKGHSHEMARIYEKAQQTVRYQDEAAKRLAVRERPMLSTSTPKRRTHAMNEFRSESKVAPLRYDDTVIHRKPVPIQPTLPEWEPLSRLSDDIPYELRTKSSIPRPLRVRVRPSTSHFVPPPLKLSKAPSLIIRSPRRRAGNGSMDSGIGMPPALERQDAMYKADDVEDDFDGFEPTKHIATTMPCAQPFEDPVAKRVATWLDSVDGSPPPSTAESENIRVDSPMEAFYQLQAQTPEQLDAGIKTPSGSSKASSHVIRDKHTSTIGRLVCIPPLRLRFPSSSSSKLGLQTLSTPPKRFKIPARGNSQSEITAMQPRHASNSSKSRSFVTANATEVLAPEEDMAVDSIVAAMPPLSPDVEVYRKGKGPKTRRQPSYWDDDLLMQKKIGQEEGEG